MARKTIVPGRPEPGDPDEIARLEARNALRQFDAAMRFINGTLEAGLPFQLRTDLICELNRYATVDIRDDAGRLRTYEVGIANSSHLPPPPNEVLKLLDEMCEYVNTVWSVRTPLHLSAYVMWRINWIHPFGDGNGRTARMVSYCLLCLRLGFLLPGSRTIPTQIARDKNPYYAALVAADRAILGGRADVSVLEKLLSEMLAAQLVAVHDKARS